MSFIHPLMTHSQLFRPGKKHPIPNHMAAQFSCQLVNHRCLRRAKRRGGWYIGSGAGVRRESTLPLRRPNRPQRSGSDRRRAGMEEEGNVHGKGIDFGAGCSTWLYEDVASARRRRPAPLIPASGLRRHGDRTIGVRKNRRRSLRHRLILN